MAVTKTSSVLIEAVWKDGSVTGMNIGSLSREDAYEFDLKLDDLSEGLSIEFRHWELEVLDIDKELGKDPNRRGREYTIRNDGFGFVIKVGQIPDLDDLSELYFQGELVLLDFQGELLNLTKLNKLSRIYLGANPGLATSVAKLYPILKAEREDEHQSAEELFSAISCEMGLSEKAVWSLLKSAGVELLEEDTVDEEVSIEELDAEASALGILDDEGEEDGR